MKVNFQMQCEEGTDPNVVKKDLEKLHEDLELTVSKDRILGKTSREIYENLFGARLMYDKEWDDWREDFPANVPAEYENRIKHVRISPKRYLCD